MQKILIVEDDELLSKSIKNFLVEEGFCVDIKDKLKGASVEGKDLVLLDWRLPDGRGIDFLKDLKNSQETQQVPVIMLTSKSDLEDKILGLELGASDYMTKPFEPKELLARINVQLRNQKKPIKEYIECGDISIKVSERLAFYKKNKVTLTKLEFNLLHLLAQNRNKVFSRDEILNKVWGFDTFPTTRTVDMHIKQLRQKFSEDCFQTVHGIGYKLVSI